MKTLFQRVAALCLMLSVCLTGTNAFASVGPKGIGLVRGLTLAPEYLEVEAQKGWFESGNTLCILLDGKVWLEAAVPEPFAEVLEIRDQLRLQIRIAREAGGVLYVNKKSMEEILGTLRLYGMGYAFKKLLSAEPYDHYSGSISIVPASRLHFEGTDLGLNVLLDGAVVMRMPMSGRQAKGNAVMLNAIVMSVKEDEFLRFSPASEIYNGDMTGVLSVSPRIMLTPEYKPD